MYPPTTPQRPEISWTPATSEDAAALSDLFNLIGSHDETPERIGHETMAHELDAYFAPLDDRTMVCRDAAGVAVGYGTVYHRPAAAIEQRLSVNVNVSPEWRGGEIGDVLLAWAVASATDLLTGLEAEERYGCGWLYKRQEASA